MKNFTNICVGVSETPDAHYIDYLYDCNNSYILKLISKLIDWDKKDRLPDSISSIIYKTYSLEHIEYDEEMNYVIFTDSRVCSYSYNYLKLLKKRHPI